MNMKNIIASAAIAAALTTPAGAVEPTIVGRVPVFTPKNTVAGEVPVAIETESRIVADNGLYRTVETMMVFTNPNSRVFDGELEFPVPDGATVCGYALEINGEMVPGVVVGKDEARVAFENEKRKGVDPGIVEHVKGNIWRTRIFPLMPNVRRRAAVTCIVPDEAEAGKTVVERDGEDVFVGVALDEKELAAASLPLAERLRRSDRARILWDATYARRNGFRADRNLLECLPEQGEFSLTVFRDIFEPVRTFASRAELLAYIDALVYDGGSCFENAVIADYDFIFAGEWREPKPRRISVRKLQNGENAPENCPVTTNRLLAIAFAANFIEDNSARAETMRERFLELGRRYGVASSVTSLIVLERLEQYLEYKIEPPQCMSFHDEWVRRRAADDDAIAHERDLTEHRSQLLNYWEERIRWWKDPIPKRETPKSGLFEGVRNIFRARSGASERGVAPEPVGLRRSEPARRVPAMRAAMSMEAVEDGVVAEAMEAAPAPLGSAAAVGGFGDANAAAMAKNAMAPNGGESVANATVTLAAWNPDMPYLKAIQEAKGAEYDEYLKQRETHGAAPAFFLDCASQFFKAGERKLGCRIISNLLDLRLDSPALLRAMGWRLREAGALDEAIAVFRKVLKLRPEEMQSKRDLALVLMERGKRDLRQADLAEAAEMYRAAAFELSARRSSRRGNDMQTAIVALEELNGLLTWAQAHNMSINVELEKVFRRDLPLDLRIVMSWDADSTDIDLHVLEPDGEEAYFGHRRTDAGGFVSEDVTTGYGPEEYLKKNAEKGIYRILSNYYASHQQNLTGAVVVTATVYTNWGKADEKSYIFSFRLDKPRDKHPIGEIEIK